MESLIYALMAFLGLHFLVSGTAIRQWLVGAVGETAYRAFFGIASVILLVWVVAAYAQAPYEALWTTPVWLRWVAIALIFFGSLFVAGGLTTKSPTLVGMDKSIGDEDIARGWLRLTRHPVMAGIRLWAAGHFLLAGHTAGVLLFTSFFVLAAAGPFMIDEKMKNKHGGAWESFREKTSIIPGIAILSGRNRFSLAELGWHRLLFGVALFFVLRYLHPWVDSLNLFQTP